MTSHSILGDKVRVYQRPNSSLWQCATYLDGKEWRVSTKTDSLSQAKDFAEDWYLELRGKSRAGLLKQEKTFADAAKHFMVEYVAITNGERNPRYVKDHEARLDNHLIPYFGKTGLSALTAGRWLSAWDRWPDSRRRGRSGSGRSRLAGSCKR